MIEELVEEIIDDLNDERGVFMHRFIYGEAFINRLEAHGFMIVPIEDPTNLRYGIED